MLRVDYRASPPQTPPTDRTIKMLLRCFSSLLCPAMLCRNESQWSEQEGLPRGEDKTTAWSDTWRKWRLRSFLVRPLRLVAEHPVPVLLRRQGLLQLSEATGAEDKKEVNNHMMHADMPTYNLAIECSHRLETARRVHYCELTPCLFFYV